MPYSVRITCTVHQAVISIEHLAVARASFFVSAVYKKKLLYAVKLQTCNCIIFQGLIDNDHLGDWSPEKDNCWRLTFRQPVRKLSSDIFLCLKMASAQVVGTSVLRRTPVTQMIIFDQGVLLLGSNHFLKKKGIHD